MLLFHCHRLIYKTLLPALLLAMFLSGCASQSTPMSRLRITNSGSIEIAKLVILFPQDRIEFGDVPARTTIEYKDEPNGVFAYAAYEFEVDGEIITQSVIDWMGESPMRGTLFTYTIDFDPNRANTGDTIRLIDVKNDD